MRDSNVSILYRKSQRNFFGETEIFAVRKSAISAAKRRTSRGRSSPAIDSDSVIEKDFYSKNHILSTCSKEKR